MKPSNQMPACRWHHLSLLHVPAVDPWPLRLGGGGAAAALLTWVWAGQLIWGAAPSQVISGHAKGLWKKKERRKLIVSGLPVSSRSTRPHRPPSLLSWLRPRRVAFSCYRCPSGEVEETKDAAKREKYSPQRWSGGVNQHRSIMMPRPLPYHPIVESTQSDDKNNSSSNRQCDRS